ncbi:U3 snoRNP protein [Tilletia horrida]|uniref:U3 snoRNP protein n=1 Tax=Tilletia horrida TaxID=155126 RepID=A0AAN6GST0_9BASI|nr:U3 snoRNP protein [Tilletia horrida]KAK0568272.1 U3 snoRNP protein [Tilletia horrida]
MSKASQQVQAQSRAGVRASGGGWKRKGKATIEDLQAQEDELAASLFGTRPAQRAKLDSRPAGFAGDDDESQEDEQEDPWTGLEHLNNEQLFTLDGGDQADGDEEGDSSEFDFEAGDGEDYDDSDEDEPRSIAHLSREPSHPQPRKPTKRKAVWTDPDDAQLIVALAGPDARAADGSFVGTKRLRKLRQHPDETEVNGLEYETRLRRIFEKYHPRPAWASRMTRGQVDYANFVPSAAAASGDANLLSDLLSRDTGLVARVTGGSGRVRSRLPPDGLEVERLRNANESQGRDEDAAIESVGFHPTSNANILMAASRDRKVRLFQIDGKANPLLHTINLPDLTLQTAQFHPLGTTAFFAGARPFFYTHDFITGTTTRSLPWRGSVDGPYRGDEAERDLSFARFQPLNGPGNLLAIGGKRGMIHLLDWGNAANSTSGANGRGSLVGSLRMNSPLVGMAWDPSDQVGGTRLVTLSKEGRAHVWDVRNMRCEAVRIDLGLYSPKGLDVSPTAILPADIESGRGPSHAWMVGSSGGIVSVYDDQFAALDSSSSTGAKLATAPAGAVPSFTAQEKMTARKTVENLTTAITTMRFNHDGQICALASRNKKDALKMVHTSSLRVFPNWPTSGTPLHHVTAVDFSRQSEPPRLPFEILASSSANLRIEVH